ncbi:NAD(+)/NADH kinase [Candidatus Ichthyocystis hellenicum]|uniref:NAD(+)/NADH kinase n=1 Tax=Candidatus Ichthyocystis hellenicum TaxID=1561003 RepID=UPI0015850DBC|nr:NAD(+)/NADH kinase [Candidatus Ichthyocystis hellenicum]
MWSTTGCTVKKKFSKIGLVVKSDLQRTNLVAIENVIAAFAKNDCIIYTTAELFKTIKERKSDLTEIIIPCEINSLHENIDLGIACGGDGTLMHLARAVVGHEIPIMGIHFGRFGFLMDVSSDRLEQQIDSIFQGKYTVEHRITLQFCAPQSTQNIGFKFAINDVLIHRGTYNRLTEFIIKIDDHELPGIRADGIIVASSTGSTGYSLSAQGSIIHPQLDAITVTPICSHNIGINNRQMVLPGNSKIEIWSPDSETTVQVDGRKYDPLIDTGKSIEITGKHRGLSMIHPIDYNYFKKLRSKFP